MDPESVWSWVQDPGGHHQPQGVGAIQGKGQAQRRRQYSCQPRHKNQNREAAADQAWHSGILEPGLLPVHRCHHPPVQSQVSDTVLVVIIPSPPAHLSYSPVSARQDCPATRSGAASTSPLRQTSEASDARAASADWEENYRG